jgi:tetratricopeptide (TPR) repeat protein
VGTAGGAGLPGTEAPASESAGGASETFDVNAEQDIADESLSAWRTAIKHVKKEASETNSDWQKQRAKDEATAMDILQDLAKRHPQQSSTVYMMMGQVEEHFGKRQAAVRYYSESMEKNSISSITLFKLAENERQLGELEKAARHYQRLLKAQPEAYPAKLGLAQCLIKTDPAQALDLAKAVLDAHADPATQKAARAIVSELKGNTRP